jgi:hypothetical protein
MGGVRGVRDGGVDVGDEGGEMSDQSVICICEHHRADHMGMGPSRGKPILSACGLCICNQWRPSKMKQIEQGEYLIIVSYGSGMRFISGQSIQSYDEAKRIAQCEYVRRHDDWLKRKQGKINDQDKRAGAEPRVSILKIKAVMPL